MANENDDMLKLYNLTVEKRKKEELYSKFAEVKKQPKRVSQKNTTKGQKIIAAIAVATILVTSLSLFENKGDSGEPIEPTPYEQYIEWVKEQEINVPINEDTYAYYLENVLPKEGPTR